MRANRITIEQALFVLALLLALAVRFSNLGVAALSDIEAEQALQALQVSGGDSADLTPGPAYALLTGTLFFVFGADNASARVLPALAGVCLIGLAFILRSKLGRLTAICLAVGLALDPGLVAISRLSGGAMLAAGFGLLALGWAYTRRPALAGLFGALALLSGPEALHGIIQIGVAGGLGYLLYRSEFLAPFWQPRQEASTTAGLRSGLLAGGGVMLFLGTLFFRFPQGLGSLAGILPAYLNGWMNASGIPASRLLAALVFYQLLPLVFAIAASIHAWRRRVVIMQWISIWVISAFGIVLLYPGRQVGDLIWVIVPLWILATWEIASHLRYGDVEWLPATGQAILISLLLALGWLNLAGLSSLGGDLQSLRLRLIVIIGMLSLGAVTALLVGLGWSFRTARRGVAWGSLFILGMFLVSNMWGATQVKANGEQDLWVPIPVTRQEGEFTETLGDLSEWNMGLRDTLDVVVTIPEASLMWSLREFPNVQFLTAIPAGEQPSVVVNAEGQPAPGLAASYRGQDFAWWVSPAWTGALPGDWARWVVFRDAPQQVRHVVLWVRGDIFPGGLLAPEVEETGEDGGSDPTGSP